MKARTVTFRNTKNGDSRSVPMTDGLRAVLQALPRPLDPTAHVLPDQDPLVLTRSFARLVKRLGLRDLTFHDLRHDVASTLTMAGVPLRTIGEILGRRWCVRPGLDPSCTVPRKHAPFQSLLL
jgi:integrase